MGEAKIDHLAAIKIGCFAKQRFVCDVVLALVEPKFIIAHVPAGEGARGLFDVVLGVIALAEAEELHYLAREIFICVALPIGVAVQPNEHRHILRHRVQQLAEAPECLGAKAVVLRGHMRHALHFGK